MPINPVERTASQPTGRVGEVGVRGGWLAFAHFYRKRKRLKISETRIRFSIMKIEIEKESDGRWIAEIPELPGVMAYGDSRSAAVAKVETLALRVIADRLEHGETVPEMAELFAVPA